MADDLQIDQYGKASVEAGQGYQAMAPAPREVEEAQQEKSAFDAGVERLSAIDQAGERHPDAIQYNKSNADGTRSDERVPDNISVTPERAAADISDYRRALIEAEQASRDVELAHEVDKLRGAEAAQPQPQQQPEVPPVQEPQPEAPTLPPELQTPENAELVAAFQREPKLLEAMNTLSWQTDQKVAAAQQQAGQVIEATQRQYVDALASYATAASATIFQAFPELNGLSADQMPAVIQAIGKQNPERAMQMSNHIQNVQLLSAKAQQAQAAQAQRYQAAQQQQFSRWASAEDDAYSAATKTDTPQRTAAIKDEVMGMLRRSGMSDQQITWEYNNNSLMRSRAGQMVLRAAALYSIQQRTAQSIRPAPVPPVKVQMPGASGEHASENDRNLVGLSNRLNQSKSVKDAAALLSARRMRSR